MTQPEPPPPVWPTLTLGEPSRIPAGRARDLADAARSLLDLVWEYHAKVWAVLTVAPNAVTGRYVESVAAARRSVAVHADVISNLDLAPDATLAAQQATRVMERTAGMTARVALRQEAVTPAGLRETLGSAYMRCDTLASIDDPEFLAVLTACRADGHCTFEAMVAAIAERSDGHTQALAFVLTNMADAGHAEDSIAQVLGVSTLRLREMAEQAGVALPQPPPPPPPPVDAREALGKILPDLAPLSQLAARLNADPFALDTLDRADAADMAVTLWTLTKHLVALHRGLADRGRGR